MSYASRSGRAHTSANRPEAFGVCDRCGIWFQRNTLAFQFDWRGVTLQNLRILVCDRCLDTPQEQLRAIVLPADPVPIVQPRPELYAVDETDFRVTAAAPIIDPTTGIPIPQGTPLVTTTGDNRTTQSLGPYGDVPPAAPNGVQLSVLSVISDGFYTITVTCSAPHGLSVGGTITAQGLAEIRADGNWPVVSVPGAMSFSYQTTQQVQTVSLMTGQSGFWAVPVGEPLGFTQIPVYPKETVYIVPYVPPVIPGGILDFSDPANSAWLAAVL